MIYWTANFLVKLYNNNNIFHEQQSPFKTLRQVCSLSKVYLTGRNTLLVVNLIKHFTIVIYDSRVVWLEKCPYYNSRVVIYARKMFIRLATGLKWDNKIRYLGHLSDSTYLMQYIPRYLLCNENCLGTYVELRFNPISALTEIRK